MKKFFYSLVTITIIFIIGISISCSFRSTQQELANEHKVEKPISPQTPNPPPTKTQNSQVMSADLEIIRKYAENYEPKPNNGEAIPSTPTASDKVLKAVDNLANSQSREHEKYIVLIFLRLHRFHIEHFKQSYDLGDNQLAKEFYRLIVESYNPNGEPKLSYLAENHVERNPELLKYSLIEKEMKRLEKAG